MRFNAYIILLYIYYTFIDALKFRWWTSTALVLFEKSHQKHHGPQTRNVWTPCDMVTLLTGSTCVHASKNHQKNKGLKQTQLTAAQDQVFLLHPHTRGTTIQHLHHTWCVCFSPTTSTCHLSLSEHQTSYITPILESRWFNFPSPPPRLLPTSICCTGARTNTPPPPLKMVDTNGRANDKGPPLGNQAPFM